MRDLILYSSISGITVFLGGLLAYRFSNHVMESFHKQKIIHGMVSFGGGIILSALALVLIPRGLEVLDIIPLSLSFLSGAIIFLLIDRYLNKKGGKTATLLAMMMDFIPESIALGATFATDLNTAILLSVFIGLQNLPEAFNAYQDVKSSGFKPRTILTIFFFLSFAGVAGALTGNFFLSDQPEITAQLMVFASGGILYLLFQDIIPEGKLRHSYVTSLWATIGFLIGIIGEKVI